MHVATGRSSLVDRGRRRRHDGVVAFQYMSARARSFRRSRRSVGESAAIISSDGIPERAAMMTTTTTMLAADPARRHTGTRVPFRNSDSPRLLRDAMCNLSRARCWHRAPPGSAFRRREPRERDRVCCICIASRRKAVPTSKVIVPGHANDCDTSTGAATGAESRAAGKGKGRPDLSGRPAIREEGARIDSPGHHDVRQCGVMETFCFLL